MGHSCMKFRYSFCVALTLNVIKLDKESHKLMGMLVCDQDSKECVVQCCSNCPDSADVSDYLLQQILHEDNDNDQDRK